MSTISRRGFLAVAAAMSQTMSGATSRPNLVMLFADDLGWGDLGCYGAAIPTPHLDRMAREGTRFTNCISANPVCSPSRAALLTGQYPTRVGVPNVLPAPDKTGLEANHKTLAEYLKPLGYSTACIGKWHLGTQPQYAARKRGFDSYYGIPYSNDMKPTIVLDNEDIVEPIADQKSLTPRYTERAIQFIQKNATNPFFLYLPYTFPHQPLFASAKFAGKTKQGIYGDVVAEVDWSVGQILDALRRNPAVARNTLVLFSSDNGPWYQGSPGPFRGRKGTTWEGGVREPFLAWQPGTVSAGRTSDALVSLMDVTPTMAKRCGVTNTAAFDGCDIHPLLNGRAADAAWNQQREALLYFNGWNLQCVRKGNWKLHVSAFNTPLYAQRPEEGRVSLWLPDPQLFDLAADPGENYDLSLKHPEIVRDLLAHAERLMAGFPAEARDAYAAMKKRPFEPSIKRGGPNPYKP